MLAIVGMKLGDTRKNTENQDEREKVWKGIENMLISK